MSRHNVRSSKYTVSTKLFTHNVDVDVLNDIELQKIEGGTITEYPMETKGREVLALALKKSCLAPEILRLKPGARVMCVKNNFEAGFVNGTLGVVVSCDVDNDPIVRTTSGKKIKISRASWKIEEDGKTKAEILQYPLRLAWTITVHKSQGMSLDAIEVDLSKSFEPGMGYVALSRVRTLEGLTILGINDMALRVHEDAQAFEDEMKKLSKSALKEFKSLSTKERAFLQEEFLAHSRGFKKEKKLATHEETALLIEEKKSLSEIAKTRGITTETVVAHIEKLIDEESRVDMRYLKHEMPSAHFVKVEKAIKEILKKEKEVRLTPIKNIVGPNVSYLNIRLARALLGHAPRGGA
jgi:DNA-binding MarR family transcriptional regulator